jgi:hypothetical protein
MFDPFYIIGVLVLLVAGIVTLITVMGIALLKFFPQSKLSNWFRRHIITDVDLEP